MRLVIEREGGFDIIEDSDRVKAVDVGGSIVSVRIGAMTVTEATRRFARASRAEALTLARAIAVKCGTLVEALAKGPEVVTEVFMSDPSEVLVPPRNPRYEPGPIVRVPKEVVAWPAWVEGEPPRDGRWYVVKRSGEDAPRVVQHRNYINSVEAFYDADGVSWRGLKSGAHLPTPIPDR